MGLIKITDLVNKLNISSRSLRYYEQVGLIHSVRSDTERYRYYNSENIEKLKQILILRKMQIPVKDIIRIYESPNMSTVVAVFVDRINTIDKEADALIELKHIMSDFLRIMLQNGITKISAIPFLYEEMEKHLNALEEYGPVTFDDLSAVSGKLDKPLEPAIISLPSMRVISSLKKETNEADTEGFWRWIQAQNIPFGEPGRHERFEFQTDTDDIIIQRIPDDFQNGGSYQDYIFSGGLFATVSIYLDEDLRERFGSLVSCFNHNKYYQIDYTSKGRLRHPAMLENLISLDDKRELVSLFVPVKKRKEDPALYDKPKLVTDISIAQIEAANPVLWEINIPPDKLLPVSDWSYRVNGKNEGVYIPVGNQHYLSTGVEVRLPFRIDINFKVDNATAAYGYGADEGNLCFHHGESFYGINKGNFAARREETITFTQPVFGNTYTYPKLGKINYGTYNWLTWIIGEKHFAVILNDEIRYCGVHFPYMSADLARQPDKLLLISGSGTATRFIKSVRISQLTLTPKVKMKNGELKMITRQSNNSIPHIHKFITNENGENYWFNGCGRYVMNALGEKDYDYEFFAGLTGDVFAQIYTYNHFRGDGVTDYMLSEGQYSFIEEIFEKCGYASTFVQEKQLKANKEMYLQTLLAYIDKGIPVISNLMITGHSAWIVFVGYEEYGETLLFMTDNMTEPERVSTEDVFCENTDDEGGRCRGIVFVGEKKAQKELRQIYRETIINLPELLTTRTENYCFGAMAFRAWADEIESGRYDNMKPEEFDAWFMYSNYVCVLATNGSCCHEFLNRAEKLNPDFTFIGKLHQLYYKMQQMWEKDPDGLEAIGGGFNITLEALQDKAMRHKIAAKIREFADCADEVVRIIRENLEAS